VKLHLDFETYSEVDITVVGGMRYAEDPSTEILIVGWSVDDDEPITVDMTEPNALWQLAYVFDLIQKGVPVGAHNAHFERAIWEKVGVPKHKFPVTPKPWQWDCTAARARMLAIPGSLDGAANALGLGETKNPIGQSLIQLFSKPHNKKGRCLPADRPEDFMFFRSYCAQDVKVEAQLDKILPPLTQVEKDAFVLDYKINDYGMPVNMDRVNAADAFVEEYSEKLIEAAVAIAGCRPSQRDKTLAYLDSRGYPFPNLQAPTVEQFIGRKDVPEDLRDLMRFRIELSRAGTKKLKAIKSCVSPDGRIRGGFLFSAASTRRWSSTGVQMHNLQKPDGETNPDVVMDLLDDVPNDLTLMFDWPLSVLAQSIRGFFEAPKNFVIADYSSVEPRGLAWSAGEDWLVEAYHKGEDVYKIAAGRVYNMAPAKIAKDSRERFVGKQIILGCGYGMGAERFIVTCATKAVPPLELSLDEAEKAVYGYRNSVPAITKFWRQTELACIKATRKWAPVQFGRFTARPETLANGFPVLYIDMPSGSICYPQPSLGTEQWNGELRNTFEFYTPLGSSWIKTDTFGGSLVENIIQAQCRDVLRDGMLAADKAGFQIAGHCHDEAIAEGEGTKEELKEFEHLLCHSSEWAEGFPIATEGFVSKVYKK
jgi:DNA polymerase bacteriophage-type